MFVGPGIYDDHLVFQNQSKQPCAVKYISNNQSKEQGRECYTVIGGNMIVYEPGFEKLSSRKQNDSLTKTNQGKIALNSIFPQNRITHMMAYRNSRQNYKNNEIQEKVAQFTKQQQQQSKYSQKLNQLSFSKDSRRPSSSFYTDLMTQESLNRPQTSFKVKRSSKSQSKNQNRNEFSNIESFQTPSSQVQMFETNTQNNSSFMGVGPIYRTQLAREFDRQQKMNKSFDYNPITRFERPKSQQKTYLAKLSRSSNRQIIDLKKSVSLLQAYGEYERQLLPESLFNDRFLEMSKQYMKEKGIIMKKTLKKNKNKKVKPLDQLPIEKSISQNPLGGESMLENIQEQSKILHEKLSSNQEILEPELDTQIEEDQLLLSQNQ
ncbi:UNKNOWN [Stylonychia lemnae]|uniref:Uncharacterized protein n=1 Tax=Stylonychia lemnae TaxID=5949 RepID=A0A078AIA5_STYLE|nr:UNKNOWN [Stylonychia lemnae]|eukprot:CDW81939.1 UNKNOWN [Stylonychia lemnae]